MINKVVSALSLLMFIVLVMPATGKAGSFEARPAIESLVNKEIFVNDTFAGQSITLVNENGKYYVIRKIFGSGVPVAATLKYSVTFDSDRQIRFSKIAGVKRVDGKDGPPEKRAREDFQLSLDENKKCRLFVNGMEIVTYTK